MWMTVWYPATRPAGQLPARFVEEPIIRSAIASTWHDRVIPMSSYALLDASLPPGELRFPVILASHGVDALRIQNDERAENLASHGYVVVATDHRDNLGLVFPDGSFRSTPEGVTAVGMNNRVQDLRFMLDQVVAWSQDDPVFAGRLDLNNVGAMGFSWGGASAAEICRVDSRFRAAVLLDPGAFTSETLSQGLSVPSLTINSAGNGDLSVYNKSVSGSVWLQISSTTHESFTDIAFIISSYSTSSIWEADRTIDAYVLAFLNQHLKEQPVTFPLPGFPRVVNVRVK
jgi:dienelactone hydrolase